MKQMIPFIALLIGTAFSASAQKTIADQAAQTSPSAQYLSPAPKTLLWNIERSQKRLVKKLNLDLDQQKKFDEINDRYVTRIAAVKEDKSLKKAARREQYKEIKTQRDTSQLNALNSNQVEIWKKAKHTKKK